MGILLIGKIFERSLEVIEKQIINKIETPVSHKLISAHLPKTFNPFTQAYADKIKRGKKEIKFGKTSYKVLSTKCFCSIIGKKLFRKKCKPKIKNITFAVVLPKDEVKISKKVWFLNRSPNFKIKNKISISIAKEIIRGI